MDYGIAIVPPEDLWSRIKEIQDRFGNNEIEPHITLKAQGGLGENIKWLEHVNLIAKQTSPFKIVLGNIRKFGNEVLYISIDSPELVALHNRIIDELNLSPEIIERYFEKELFTPHLTLGRTQAGFNQEDFPKMKELTEEMLKVSDTSFQAEFMRVYSIEKGDCRPKEDIYFEGSINPGL
jgi:2'-5' RNA ligase